MRLSIRLVALVLFALVAGAARAGASPDRFAFGPVPAWVERAPVELSAPSDSDGALVDELSDDQLRWAPTRERYVRWVRRIHAIAGVERAGEISIDFDPSYERLTIHAIHVLRGGETIDARAAATIRVLERESDLDERIYDGRLTVSIVLGDLRIGDATDLEYTIAGTNPVFGRHALAVMELGTRHGVKHLRLRVLTPASLSVAHRVSQADLTPATRTLGDEREEVWDRRGVPAPPEEDGLPAWVDEVPSVTLSDFASWGDVAAWAVPLYETAPKPSGPLADRVAQIAAQGKTPEERALVATRFVQDEVRYLGMELGESSHRPHDPTQVLTQRFGDCKDKALLLVTLLRALGVDASTALVDTDLRAHLDDQLPSPRAFDHVVVRVALPSKIVWVDATLTDERGPLGGVPLPFARALVIAPGTTGLERIDEPAPAEPTTEALERFALAGSAATLDVTTTYRGDDATYMRGHLARTPREQTQKDYLDFYSSRFKTIERRGDLSVRDDTARNVVVVGERYAIKDALPEGTLDVWAFDVRSFVKKPRVTRRASPLAVMHPTFVRDRIEIRGARFDLPDDTRAESPAVVFTSHAEAHDDASVLTFELRTRAGEVKPADVAVHVAALTSILDATSLSLPVAAPSADANAEANSWAGWATTLGTLGVVALVAAFRIAIRRHRWARHSKSSVGESAALPIGVASRSDAERVLVDGRCGCGTSMTGPLPESAWTRVRLGEREIVVGRATCSWCSETRVRYFAVGGG